MLRRLHALPPFPKAFNYVTAHNGFHLEIPLRQIFFRKEIRSSLHPLRTSLRRLPVLDSDIVSSHMDLKPENILFDGQRIWLVDWQAAFVNDRYFDLAVAANFLVTNDADELTYSKDILRPIQTNTSGKVFPDASGVAHVLRFIFLMLASAGKPLNLSESLPSFTDFHRRIWAGEVSMADKEKWVVYGIVHWRQLLHNMRQPQFEEALRIVSERNSLSGDLPRLLPLAQCEASSLKVI